jgi:hypothetical protein
MWYFVIYSSTTTKAFNGLWISVSSVLGLGLGAQGGAGAGTTLQFRIWVSGEQGDRYRPGHWRAFNGPQIGVSSVLRLGLGAQGGGAGAGTTLQFRIRVSGEQGDRYRPGATGGRVKKIRYRKTLGWYWKFGGDYPVYFF